MGSAVPLQGLYAGTATLVNEHSHLRKFYLSALLTRGICLGVGGMSNPRFCVRGLVTIVPWNMPQLGALTKIVPALPAGCTVILKPALETPTDTQLLAEIIDEIGLPDGVVNIVPGGPEVGDQLVSHPGIDKVSFTGSTDAGRRVASLCGHDLKRVNLELGGKSAAIVLDDADLAAVMAGLKLASFANSSQTCIAQPRIPASRANYDTVVNAVSELAASTNRGIGIVAGRNTVRR
jgi:aldehyde dehydrogenase (NAD+)